MRHTVPMIDVRRGTPDDLETVLRLVAAYCLADGHLWDEAGARGALTPLLAGDEHGQVWVAQDGEHLVGYAVLTWGWSVESGGREALLDELYAARSGAGIGSALVVRCVSAAQEAGARAIFLETEVDNDGARGLYRKHGFSEELSVWMRLPL